MDEHRKFTELAFSKAEDKQLEENENLINAIDKYFLAFKNTIDSLSDVIDIYSFGDDKDESHFEDDISQILLKIGNNSNKLRLENLRDSYQLVIDESRNTFSENKKFKLQGVNLFNFLSKATVLFENSANFESENLLSLISVSKVVVSLLYTIYECYRKGRNDESFYFVRRGCEILNLTWCRLFRNTYFGLSKWNLIKTIVCGALKSPKKKSIIQIKDNDAKLCVTYAQYPYDFSYNMNSSFKITGLKHIKSKKLNCIYNSATCQLKIARSLGLAVAFFECVGQNKCCLSFAGTRLHSGLQIAVENLITDFAQLFLGPDATYAASVGLLEEVEKELNWENIIVTGHSLGGGLVQFAIGCVGTITTEGICFNPAGLSNKSAKLAEKCGIKNTNKNIRLICAKTDFISPIGKFFGKKEYIDTGKKFSHCLDHLNKEINGSVKKVLVI